MEDINVVSENPCVCLLKLPDGCDPGRWEAAQSFAESLKGLREKYPGKAFQYVPFAQDSCGATAVIMAIES